MTYNQAQLDKIGQIRVPYFFEYKPRLLFIFNVILSGFYSRVAFIIFCRHTIKRAKQTSSNKNIQSLQLSGNTLLLRPKHGNWYPAV